MIQVFCSKRGSGKTKQLIDLANNGVRTSKGSSVYIDDDQKPILQLRREIRFVSTNEYNVDTPETFYGMLCGLLSSDYDLENMYIDGLSNIVKATVDEMNWLFMMIKSMSEENDINIYINENCDDINEVPHFIKEYVA